MSTLFCTASSIQARSATAAEPHACGCWQVQWFTYGTKDYNRDQIAQLAAAANNQTSLLTTFTSLAPWFQVAAYINLVNTRYWDYVFIDKNVPAPTNTRASRLSTLALGSTSSPAPR